MLRQRRALRLLPSVESVVVRNSAGRELAQPCRHPKIPGLDADYCQQCKIYWVNNHTICLKACVSDMAWIVEQEMNRDLINPDESVMAQRVCRSAKRRSGKKRIMEIV